MSKPLKTNSLKSIFNAAAQTGVASMTAAAVAGGPALGIAAAATGAMGLAGMVFGKKKKSFAEAAPVAEKIEVAEEDIVVETGAPVKLMKRITLRR